MDQAPEGSGLAQGGAPVQKTEREYWHGLHQWLEQPAQKTVIATRTLGEGPLLPESSLLMIGSQEMYNAIQQAFHQGCKSATESSIKYPELPVGVGNTASMVLWSYFNQGYTIASKDNSPPRAEHQSKSSDMKLPAPSKFTGIRDELEAFIRTLHIKFNMEASRFSTDIQKIAYASSFLDKDAKIWFTPYMDKDTGAIKFNYYL